MASQIVYEHTGISIVNVADSSVLTLTTNADDKEPAWSPDGTQIAFDSFNREGRFHPTSLPS